MENEWRNKIRQKTDIYFREILKNKKKKLEINIKKKQKRRGRKKKLSYYCL